MNIKIQTTTETNMEIVTPYYAKQSHYFFKIIDEKTALQICTLVGCESVIHIANPERIFEQGCEQIIPDEYYQALHNILNTLIEL